MIKFFIRFFSSDDEAMLVVVIVFSKIDYGMVVAKNRRKVPEKRRFE